VKDHLNKAYRNYVANLTASFPSKPKKFWSFVKTRTGNSSIQSYVEYGGQTAITPKGKLIFLTHSFVNLANAL